MDPLQAEYLKSHVRKRWDFLKTVREPRERRWADAELAFRVERVRSYYNGRSQLTLPVGMVIVERIVPNVVSTTVGRGEFFEARAKSSSGIHKSAVNVALLHNQMDDDEFRAKFTPFIREVVVKGVGVWKCQWAMDRRKVTRTVRVEDPVGMGPNGMIMEPRFETREDTVTLANRPSGEPRDPFHVWYDHRVSHENLTDWIEDDHVTADWLLRKVDAGVFDADEVTRAIAAGPGSAAVESYQESRLARSENRLDSAGIRNQEKFHYVEFWGRVPEDMSDEGEKKSRSVEMVIGILNNEYVVRADPNPYQFQDKPYRIARILPITRTLDGVSILSVNMGLIIEKNDKRNQALDNSTLANNPMLLDIGGNADKQSYRAGPGKVLHAAGDTLKPFVLPDMAGGLYRDQAVLDKDIEEAAGAPPLLSGIQQPGVGSATEFAGLTQNASVQIVKYAHAIEDTFIKPVLNLYHRYNQQYLPKDVAVRMVGEEGLDFLSVQREDTLVDLEFIVTGASSMQSKAQLMAGWGILLPQYIQVAMLNPGSVDVEGLLGRILKDVFAFDHPEVYVRGAKKAGPVRSPEEVFAVLTQGQNVVPDPRADLYEQLKEIGGYTMQMMEAAKQTGRTVPKPIMDTVLRYIEVATQVLQQQIAQQLQAQTMMALGVKAASGGGMADTGEGGGGGSNTSKGGADRDGKGMTDGRQAMKATRPMGQGV